MKKGFNKVKDSLKHFKLKKIYKVSNVLRKGFNKLPFHEKIEEKAAEIILGLLCGYVGQRLFAE